MSSPLSKRDFLIVGAGFAGATMARLLAEHGQKVLVVEKRGHIGGNAYDYVNSDGVLIQKYGVHAFHTNSDAIWEFLSRFTEWAPYEHRVQACVDGELVTFPPNQDTLWTLGYEPDAEHGLRIPEPKTAEEQCLSVVGPSLYQIFFKGYTQKHWGKHPRELDASVTARIPFRPTSREDRVFTDKHQAIPKHGYTKLFERLLDHPNIHLQLHCPYDHVMMWRDRVIFTGPIDEYYGWDLGRLPYRSLKFFHQTYPGRDLRQPCTQINYPALWQPFTRTIEWRHITGQDIDCTTITTEFPSGEGEPYYPIPCADSKALYKRYEARGRAEKNVTFLGRLGTYQYLNMDQVVGQAMAAFRRLNLTNPATV